MTCIDVCTLPVIRVLEKQGSSVTQVNYSLHVHWTLLLLLLLLLKHQQMARRASYRLLKHKTNNYYITVHKIKKEEEKLDQF